MQNGDAESLKLGWSDFAVERYLADEQRRAFTGDPAELLQRVRAAWDLRCPGAGRGDLEQVVVVSVDPTDFVGGTVRVDAGMALHAKLVRRQSHEDPYLQISADGPPEPVRFASVVLYAAATLLENGGARSGDFDWEIVALIAGPIAEEPMDPLTMARNLLEKPGGTYCDYTAAQFAESVWYWACRAKVYAPPPAGGPK